MKVEYDNIQAGDRLVVHGAEYVVLGKVEHGGMKVVVLQNWALGGLHAFSDKTFEYNNWQLKVHVPTYKVEIRRPEKDERYLLTDHLGTAVVQGGRGLERPVIVEEL